MHAKQSTPIQQKTIYSPDTIPFFHTATIHALRPIIEQFPMKVPSYYLNLMSSLQSPAAMMALPSIAEGEDCTLPADPLCEENMMPVPGLIHRYPDRAVLLITDTCALYCRFCLRKRRIGKPSAINKNTINTAIEYIARHPSLKEIILSGGDPLTLPLTYLRTIIERLRRINHISVLRIGTRLPAVNPTLIHTPLAEYLGSVQPLYLLMHFNHPDELTYESRAACSLLAEHGIPLMNQSVLLRGVNDNAETLAALFRGLLHMRVRPYYLHQCDPVRGTAHFRVPLQRGLDIMRQLRGYISGLAVPHFMIDLPGGGGKIPLLPDYHIKKNASSITLQNYEGKIFKYPL